MLDQLARGLLSLTHDTFLIPFIVFGYIWLDRKIFYHATCLLLLSIIFNAALKVTFQIPLAASVGKVGFAFPSGHMQQATTFFSYLVLHTSARFWRILLAILLLGISQSLVYCGYHNYLDVLAASGFAILLVSIYIKIIKHYPQGAPWLISCAIFLMLGYIDLRINTISNHLWMACSALLGFILANRLFPEKSHHKAKLVTKILRTAACCLSTASIVGIFSLARQHGLPAPLLNAEWFLMVFAIPYLCKKFSMDR